MRLIGITGMAGAGKDTAADHLCQNHAFAKTSFAFPIKQAVMAMFGLTEAALDWPLKEGVIPSIGRSPRFLMQTLGTEWGRDLVDKDVWVKIAKSRWEATKEYAANGRCATKGIVFADVRFPNEAEFIRSEGLLLHVVRPGNKGTTESAHISEAGIQFMPGDAIIENRSSLQSLCLQMDFVISAGAKAYATA